MFRIKDKSRDWLVKNTGARSLLNQKGKSYGQTGWNQGPKGVRATEAKQVIKKGSQRSQGRPNEVKAIGAKKVRFMGKTGKSQKPRRQGSSGKEGKKARR